MEKIKILFIRDSCGLFGAERVILTLLKNINRSIFDIRLVCLDSGGNCTDLLEETFKIDIDSRVLKIKGKIDIPAIHLLRRYIATNKIDIVHSHDYKSNFYCFLATIGLKLKRVITAHGSTKETFIKRMYLSIDKYFIYPFCHKIISVSSELSETLNKILFIKDKLVLIPNGFDISALESPSCKQNLPLSVPENSFVFGVVGRLFPDKGHKYFIEAFSRLYRDYPNIYGLIIGEGPGYVDIKNAITELNVRQSIQMCGYRSDMREVYNQIDVLVIPSLTEGLPYVLLEAMSCGVLVIGTSVGDIPKLIIDNISGFLVPPKDSLKIEQKMKTILEDPTRYNHIIINAREIVQKKYSSKIMIEKIQSLYKDLSAHDTERNYK